MPNTITGRVLSVGQPLQVAGKDPSRPFIKRELVLDCTRYDPYTGERSKFENTPLLEFGGDICKDLDGIRPGDVVTVSFDITGTKYQDKTTRQEKIFTRVRPYKVEKHSAQQAVQAQPQQYAQQPQQYAQQPQQYAQPQSPVTSSSPAYDPFMPPYDAPQPERPF